MRGTPAVLAAILWVASWSWPCVAGHAGPSPESVVPKASFGFWESSDVLENNNCYNYATNRRTDSFAQPGEGGGLSEGDVTCKSAIKGASGDPGLTVTEFFPYQGKNDDLLIALVVAPLLDFHFYRRGDDNLWTHKPGSGQPSAEDQRGHKIASPETADRGIYTKFCGYFRLKNYKTEDDEQNGGYVQIGNMTGLPPISIVQMSMYSGRPDPQIPLRKLLEVVDLRPLGAIAANGERQGGLPAAFSRLGYRGLRVIDREGLWLPKGSVAWIRGDSVYVQLPGLNEIWKSEVPGIENGILPAFWE